VSYIKILHEFSSLGDVTYGYLSFMVCKHL